jgi:hypothetical protein
MRQSLTTTVTASDEILKLFQKTELSERSQTTQILYQLYNEDGTKLEFLTPRFYAMLLLTEYYRLKYGVQIIVCRDDEDIRKLPHLIKLLKEQPRTCSFGFILNRSAFYPNMIDEIMSSNLGHACPVVYQKTNAKSYLVALDSIAMRSYDSNLHMQDLKDIAKCGAIDILLPTQPLQRFDASCHDFSVVMLKDALRIENISNIISQYIEGQQSEFYYFNQFPEDLLKFSQTQSSLKDKNLEFAIIRSNTDKEPTRLDVYRGKREEHFYRLDEDQDYVEKVVRNVGLVRKAQTNPIRAQMVFNHYKQINPDLTVRELLQKLQDQQQTFFESPNPIENVVRLKPAKSLHPISIENTKVIEREDQTYNSIA